MKRNLSVIILIVLQLLFIYSCTSSRVSGWKTSNLESEGIDENMIRKLANQIDEGKYEGQRSLVIIKNGKLVYEKYFDGYSHSDLFRIYSVSKSVTSLLVGIAIEKGFLSSVDEKLVDQLPEYDDLFLDERKRSITIRHLLTMAAGFEWNENDYGFNDTRNSHTQMDDSDDWIRFLLSRDIAFTPGEKWVYNTAATHLLGYLVKVKSGMQLADFAEKYLFQDLQIYDFEWNTDPLGNYCAGGSFGGLRLKTTDMAKIGQLILNNGVWNGKQIVNKNWITESTQSHISADMVNNYGYQWWLQDFTIKGKQIEAIMGLGYGGQSIHIFPSLNLVIAINSWGRQPRAQTLSAILRVLNATVKKIK